MANNFFNIPTLNSFRWFPKNPVKDSRYNTLPFDQQQNNYNPSGVYNQKWQRNDKGQVQLLSDFVPTLNFYKCGSGIPYLNVPINPVSTSLIGVSFLCYQAEVEFADFAEGKYFGEISYSNVSNATGSGTLGENITPYIDVNFQAKVNGVEKVNLFVNGEFGSFNEPAGGAYSFQAYIGAAPTSPNAKFRLTIYRDDEIIHDEMIVATAGATITKTGILQSGAVYRFVPSSIETTAIITTIDVDDNQPVDTTEIVWETSPMEVKNSQPDTLLAEYKNTFNTKGVIFQPTGIEFNFRFEGLIQDIDPNAEVELFDDQEHNVTLENSIPFSNFTMFIGRARGVPDWVIEKMNLIFSVDQKKFDGVYYEKAEEGSKFTPTRPENTRNRDGFWSLPVTPNENFFIDAFNVGPNGNDENDIQVITRSKQYILNGADIVCANVFKKFSTLVGLQIDNRSLESFTLLVGTTPGGMDVAKLIITDEICDFYEINKGFDSIKTIYLTGLTGRDTDVTILYYQLDDRTTITANPMANFPKGFGAMYIEQTDGDFENDFDITTGLGINNYTGWAIRDGRNGTDNMAGKSITGWNSLQPTQRDTDIGTAGNLVTLVQAQLPNVRIDIPDLSVNTSYRTGGNTQHAAANDPAAPRAQTSPLGSGQPFSIQNYSRITCLIVKITE